MKWGRKPPKQQQEEKEKKHSTSSFSISNILPLCWFSKLRNLSSKPSKPMRNVPGPVSFPPPPPSPRHRSASDHLSFSPAILDRIVARFPASFHDAGDAPRRRSMGEDDSLLARDRTSHRRGIARSARHNSVGELDFRPPPPSSFTDRQPNLELAKSQLLGHLIPFSRRSSRRQPRNLEPASESEKSESDPSRLRHRRLRRRRRRSKAGRECGGASEEMEGLPARKTKPPPVSDHDRTEENRWGGEARKSISGRIRPKVRVCSPRPSVASRAEMGRVKARRRAEAEKKGLESFAVVKCSCDPQKDFRESMVEMIWEKRIGRPEELESLLACYLSLNSDEHHDVIVKVFRQVWFDLNPERFSSHRFNG